MATYGNYGQRASRIGPGSICRSDFPHPIQFCSVFFFFFFFFQEGMDHIVQNRPRSDQDGLVSVRPNASCLEASCCTGIIGPGFLQYTTDPLPVSHFQNRFCSSTDVPDNIVQNHPGSNLVLADCVRFWPKGSGPEASQCARIIWPMLPSRSGPDANRIWNFYWG